MNDITRAYTASQLLALAPSVLGAVAAATAVNGPTTVSRYLGLAATLIGQGASAYNSLVLLKNTVQRMVAEGREPTDDEWAAMEGRSNVAHSAIQDYDIDAEADLDRPDPEVKQTHVPLPDMADVSEPGQTAEELDGEEPAEDATTAKSSKRGRSNIADAK